MLVYLDNASSKKANPNENYARELDGAAHARRQRRLHADATSSKSPRRSPAGRCRTGSSSSTPPTTTPPPRSCSASSCRPGAASRTASRCSTSSRAHPSTARFICTKLSRLFVSDKPPSTARRPVRQQLPRLAAVKWAPSVADHPALTGVRRCRELPRQGEDAARVRGRCRAQLRRQHRTGTI